MLLATAALMFIGLALTSGPAGALTAHQPIRVDSKLDLMALGMPGSGTEDDPFIIEGLEINATGAGVGIYVGNVSHVVIKDNLVHGAGSPDGKPHVFAWDAGIALNNVQGFTVSGNWIEGNRGPGIHLEGAHSGDVSTNTVVENGKGLYVSLSYNSKAWANTFRNNTGHGVHLGGEASLAVLWDNNFVDNNGREPQAMDEGQRNRWDDGRNGNYWSDYETRYPTAMRIDDRVWDTPYDVSSAVSKAQDGFPLVKRIDKASPMLMSVVSGPVTTGDPLVVTVRVRDDFGTEMVSMDLRAGGKDTTHDFYEAFPTVWKLSGVSAPSDSVEPLTYKVRAVDSAGNSATSPVSVLPVRDDDPPTAVLNDGQDVRMNKGELIEWVATDSTDNIGVENYTWSFSGSGGDRWFRYGGSWEWRADRADVFVVSVTVRDATGNTDTAWVNLTIVDPLDVDTDNDGIPDYLDPDDDGDGWTDSEEDVYFSDPADKDSVPLDTDGDGIPDLLDPDDDDDGFFDWDEEGAGTDDTDDSSVPADLDTDGTPDYRDDDDDGDGVLDGTELAAGFDPRDDGSTPPDTDGDGIPDFLDPDDDNDRVPDGTELAAGFDPTDDTSAPPDTDGDGAYDFRDPDDDDDGVPDDLEEEAGFDPTDDSSTPQDTDGDGTIDALDDDDDDDGIPDAVEDLYGLDPMDPSDALEDADGDGVSNRDAIARGWDPVDKESVEGSIQTEGDPDWPIIVGAVLGGALLGGIAGAGACSMRKRPGRHKYDDVTPRRGYMEEGGANDKTHRLHRGTRKKSSSDNPLTRTDRTEDSMSMATHSEASEPGRVNVSQVQEESSYSIPEVDDEVLTAFDAHGHVTVLKNADLPDTGGHETGHNLDLGHQEASTSPGERLNRPDFGSGLEGEVDTGGMKAHTDGAAKQAADATSGEGLTEPGSVSHSTGPGEGTAAHEAAHVVQQGSGGTGGGEGAVERGGSNHNTTRSNRTQPTADTSGGGEGRGDISSAKAHDYNSSRSNTTSSAARPDGGAGGGEGGGNRAQDYNSSRSNAEYNYDRTSTTDDSGLSKADSKRGLDTDGDGEGDGTRAQDYNSSRSNTTASTGPESDTPGGGGGEERLTVNEEGVEEDVGDNRNKGRKSGNESSAIGTLR